MRVTEREKGRREKERSEREPKLVPVYRHAGLDMIQEEEEEEEGKEGGKSWRPDGMVLKNSNQVKKAGVKGTKISRGFCRKESVEV